MIIQSVELKDFRNYGNLELSLTPGINLFYGSNAQGKTNILESVYVGCTSKSHKAAKDRELIRFGKEEAHIKLSLVKKEVPQRIDMHIKKNNAKGIAVNQVPIRRASELFGIANVVFFSPEDLNLIKNGPAERRRFMDLELCQLQKIYLHNLLSYNRVVNQKNRVLKELDFHPDYESFLDVYNTQMVGFGTELIRIRESFLRQLGEIAAAVHARITGGREELALCYEPNANAEEFAEEIKRHAAQEKKQGMSLVGPHRDDFSFRINGSDVRHFGSQGQQRTAVLSLKLAELKLVEETVSDAPVLLLDDVLSELDRQRQDMLLNSIGGIQTLVTCTGLDDFVDHRVPVDQVFYVENGQVTGKP